jgi:hypothetical protein
MHLLSFAAIIAIAILFFRKLKQLLNRKVEATASRISEIDLKALFEQLNLVKFPSLRDFSRQEESFEQDHSLIGSKTEKWKITFELDAAFNHYFREINVIANQAKLRFDYVSFLKRDFGWSFLFQVPTWDKNHLIRGKKDEIQFVDHGYTGFLNGQFQFYIQPTLILSSKHYSFVGGSLPSSKSFLQEFEKNIDWEEVRLSTLDVLWGLASTKVLVSAEGSA